MMTNNTNSLNHLLNIHKKDDIRRQNSNTIFINEDCIPYYLNTKRDISPKKNLKTKSEILNVVYSQNLMRSSPNNRPSKIKKKELSLQTDNQSASLFKLNLAKICTHYEFYSYC